MQRCLFVKSCCFQSGRVRYLLTLGPPRLSQQEGCCRGRVSRMKPLNYHLAKAICDPPRCGAQVHTRESERGCHAAKTKAINRGGGALRNVHSKACRTNFLYSDQPAVRQLSKEPLARKFERPNGRRWYPTCWVVQKFGIKTFPGRVVYILHHFARGVPTNESTFDAANYCACPSLLLHFPT